MLPWEVNAVDILKIAVAFPSLNLMGGIYKHMFEPASPSQAGRFQTTDVRREIDRELARVVAPLRARGGYIASLDHFIHAGVRYPDLVYYCEALEREYGKANRSSRFEKKAKIQ